MPDLTHSTLASASVHEPKHITTNGTSASGSVITSSSSTSGISEYRRLKQTDLDDLEVLWQIQEFDGAAAAQTHYIPATFGGEIINIDGIVNIAVAGGTNSYKMTIDGVDVTGSAHSFTTTAGSGGTAGDIISATPSAANAFNDGSVITLENTAKANTETALDIRWVITCRRA
jgi:hypothetical protein